MTANQIQDYQATDEVSINFTVPWAVQLFNHGTPINLNFKSHLFVENTPFATIWSQNAVRG